GTSRGKREAALSGRRGAEGTLVRAGGRACEVFRHDAPGIRAPRRRLLRSLFRGAARDAAASGPGDQMKSWVVPVFLLAAGASAGPAMRGQAPRPDVVFFDDF